eukprot:96755-Amorphochlora_amoeboformis.AAC.1
MPHFIKVEKSVVHPLTPTPITLVLPKGNRRANKQSQTQRPFETPSIVTLNRRYPFALSIVQKTGYPTRRPRMGTPVVCIVTPGRPVRP